MPAVLGQLLVNVVTLMLINFALPITSPCMDTPVQKLTRLVSVIQNARATQTGVREIEKIVQQAITGPEPLTLLKELLLSIRAKASQRGLHTDVIHHLKQYWLTDDKVNHLSKIA